MEKPAARTRLSVLLALLAVFVSACSDGDDPVTPAPTPPTTEPPQEASGFVDRTQDVGLRVPGSGVFPVSEETAIVGGVAAGDIDRDGDIDLFLVSTPNGLNALFLNDGSGNFEDVASAYGISDMPQLESGPLFADLHGDGFLDLVVGGVRSPAERGVIRSVRIFRNEGGQSSTDITATSGLDLPDETDTYS